VGGQFSKPGGEQYAWESILGGTLRGVTVGVVNTVVLVVITVGGTLVVTVGEGACHSGWSLGVG